MSFENNNFRVAANSGIISATVFVVLDLIILTILDVALGRLVCAFYYRQIDRGEPVKVVSADIVGVTNFLVGNRFHFANALALLIKLAFFACILFIDLNISSTTRYKEESRNASALYDFDPRDETWMDDQGRIMHRVVERRFEQTRACRDVHGERVIFYPVVFDLHDDVVLADETAHPNSTEMYYVDDSSIRCIKPANLRNASDAHPIAEITGCSKKYGNGVCQSTSPHTFSVNLPLLYVGPPGVTLQTSLSFPDRSQFFYWEYSGKVSAEIFPEYAKHDPKVSCLLTNFGVQDGGSLREKTFSACLVIASLDGGTLIERWSLNRTVGATESGVFTRKFAGPIFKGDPEMGLTQKVVSLRTFLTNENWLSFSANLVADAVVYRNVSTTFTLRESVGTVATVPVFALILSVAMICVAIAARCAAHFAIPNDSRPSFNSVNGMSMLTQMNQSSGSGEQKRSVNGTEEYLTVGLCWRNNTQHLGPLRKGEEPVARSVCTS